MSGTDLRILLARLLMLLAVVCGIIGLVIGIDDRTWKLNVVGWFTGGSLLAILAIVVLADEFLASRRKEGKS
jgi:hypothetical protein